MKSDRKIQTVLFGASESLDYFIDNTKHERDFLACVDNNSELWGKFINEVRIIAPDEIERLEFDQIVILTQWCKEVIKQLVNDLGIRRDRILVPDRRLLGKPMFQNEQMQQSGNAIIDLLMQKAINGNIPLVVDMGTLLGIIRDGRLIPWDSDIDFALSIDFMEILYKITLDIFELENLPFKIGFPKRMLKDDRLVQIEFSCFCGSDNILNFPVTINARESIGEESVWVAFDGLWKAPKKHFDQISNFFYNQSIIQTPSYPLEYLNYMYGSDWSIPKADFTYDDYPNN